MSFWKKLFKGKETNTSSPGLRNNVRAATGDYGFIEGPDGFICAIFLSDPSVASDRAILRMMIVDKEAFPTEGYACILEGQYEVVPAILPDGKDGVCVLFPWAPKNLHVPSNLPMRLNDPTTTSRESEHDRSSTDNKDKEAQRSLEHKSAKTDLTTERTKTVKPREAQQAPNTKKIYSEKDFATLPRWARVAFTARCARRAESALITFGDTKLMDPARILDEVIGVAERCAATARVIEQDIERAKLALAKFWEKVGCPTFIQVGTSPPKTIVCAQSAGSAVEAALDLSERDDERSAQISTNFAFAACGTRGEGMVCETTFSAVEHDYKRLYDLCKSHAFTDETPVSPDIFGALWPNGTPSAWRA